MTPPSTYDRAFRVASNTAHHVASAVQKAVGAVDPDVWAHVRQIPLAGVTQLWPQTTEIRPKPDDGHPPVLLIHGLGGRPGNLALVRARLAWAGRRRVYAIRFTAPDIPQMAGQVREAIAAILAINAIPDAQIDIVAHSLGGIVTREALDDPQTAARVRAVVTLGSPHRGTWAARFAGTPLTRELRPDSERLATPWSPPEGVRFTSVVGAADVIITPGEYADLGAGATVELAGITHLSLLTHPAALDAIVDAIAYPAPSSSGESGEA